jgi:hypothetical protein
MNNTVNRLCNFNLFSNLRGVVLQTVTKSSQMINGTDKEVAAKRVQPPWAPPTAAASSSDKQLHLYNSFTRNKEPFVARNPDQVGDKPGAIG